MPIRLSLSKVGVATGIARNALTIFTAIAANKIPVGARATLSESPGVQLALANAEAQLRSGRAFALEMVRTVWDATVNDRAITPHDRTLIRLACASCCRDAVTAVDLVAAHAGMTASTGPRAFTRAIRDIRVVPQHFWVAPAAIADAGRVLTPIVHEKSVEVRVGLVDGRCRAASGFRHESCSAVGPFRVRKAGMSGVGAWTGR